VLEAVLPFSVLLAGAGIGDLIKKIVFVGRGNGEGTAGATKERPRIQVTGPKVKPEICQICMGRIKEGSEYVRCSGGKVFHSVCLARVGDCPYCRRTFAIKGREDTTSRNYVQPISPPAVSEVPPPNSAPCPVCGEAIDPAVNGCGACGAIFVADGGSFPCPGCGSTVQESDLQCRRCGEPFHQFTPRTCPVCGAVIPANAEACTCGAILNDRCPECGAGLPENTVECKTCGAVFEFV
jgi:predicted RNA-binding Zn-ribbon protein involved in translation (DUF1610 family)